MVTLNEIVARSSSMTIGSTPWRSQLRKTTMRPSAASMCPLDIFARLAALVPKPRINLVRFHRP